MKYRVKNWRQFQHYKDRNPPWIKLHFALLSSADWVALNDASRVLAIACMLVASRNDGEIDGSEAGLVYLRRVAYLSAKPNLSPLIECGFLESASKPLALAQADARPETETEDLNQKEKSNVGLAPDAPPPLKLNGHTTQAREVLAFLNEKTGRDYQPVSANLDRIAARLKEGASVEDCRAVIAKKCREWATDDRMSQYLRPATLFNAEKFAQYRGELNA